MELKLKGRSVLITGASRGIGLAIARVFASEGCVLHLAARDPDRLRKAADELGNTHGIPVAVHPCDLSRTADVERLGGVCGEVDILVNNAGGIPRGNLQEIDGATWRRAWDLKVFGFIDLTRIVIPRMYAKRRGVVVNVIGSAGEHPEPNYIAGCVGNAALIMFVQCLGAESIRHGVRVVAVNPGPIMTDRFLEGVQRRAERQYGDASRWPDLLKSELPRGQAGTPEEVAHTVVFLASDLAANTSAACIRMDGGFLSHFRASGARTSA